MKNNNRKSADMPQFLALLESQVETLNQLQGITPKYGQVNHAIESHIQMLMMYLEMERERMKFREEAIMEGEALSEFLKNFLGGNSYVGKYAEELTRVLDSQDLHEKDVQVVKSLVNQVRRLQNLKGKLLGKVNINEVVKEGIEILKELPNVFPKGAPIRETFRKRLEKLK